MSPRPLLVGVNHVALEVGDLEAALAWYGRVFDFELRGRGERAAFLDMGDQFLALSEGRSQAPDDDRHFGLVVDDKDAARGALEEAGAEILPGRGLDFRDPWGNRVQVVAYADVQFSKTHGVARALGIDPSKSPRAREELRSKGIHAEGDPAQAGVDELARILAEAKEAHGEYERELGEPHEEWPAWYAEFVLARIHAGSEPD